MFEIFEEIIFFRSLEFQNEKKSRSAEKSRKKIILKKFEKKSFFN